MKAMTAIKFNRVWAMPNADTFSIPPIREFVSRYLAASKISVDPFARNCDLATLTNDLNPKTRAKRHLESWEFLNVLQADGVSADLLLFDPPYSPRQMSECYDSVGIRASMQQTQNGALYKRTRDAAMGCLRRGATVLSFGWNSAGMGKERGFEIVEILMVAHGGAHNDTICIAEVGT